MASTLTPEQQSLRSTGIGASEIASVAGLHPTYGPIDVYLEKLGLAAFESNEVMEAGVWMEPHLRNWYASERNCQVDVPGTLISTLVHPTDSLRICTPDGIAHLNGQRRGVEIKNKGQWEAGRWGEPGTDEVPVEVAAQCLWSIPIALACGVITEPCWDVVVLIGGNKRRIYTVQADEGIETRLVSIAGRFWQDHVVPRIPPEMDDSDAAKELLRHLFPADSGLVRTATNSEGALIAVYREVQRRSKLAETEKEEVGNQLRYAIGELAGLTIPEVGTVTWKKAKDSEVVDWEAVAIDLGTFNRDQFNEAVAAHKSTRPGSRRLLTKFIDDKEK